MSRNSGVKIVSHKCTQYLGHWSVAVLIVVVINSGCGRPAGPERAKVFGSVTFDGEEVTEGSIAFIPVEGTSGPTSGGLIMAGKYDISERGPAPGKYRVEILASRKTGRQIELAPPSPPGTMMDEIEHFIPAKYNTNSELLVEISLGRNELGFELTK